MRKFVVGEPASGYDLKAVLDHRIGHFWAAELSQDSGTPRDIGAPDGAFRFSLQRRHPGGRFLRG
jgi:hypothetical protein